MALRTAMLICQDLGMHQVTFESDCKGVVSGVVSREESESMLYPMIQDIQMLIIR